MKTNFLNGRREKADGGFTLVEALLATTTLAIAISAVMTLSQLFLDSMKASKTQRAVSNYRDLLVENLRSYSGWRATVVSPLTANTAALSCLRVSTVASDCTGSSALNTDTLIAVVNGDNGLIADSSDLASGFQYDGRNCTGFSAPPAPGNSDCPLRFDVTVRLICPMPIDPDTCTNPEIYLQGRLRHNSGPNGQAINPARYSFGFVRSLDKNTVRRACEAAGGWYARDPGTGDESCTMANTGICPPGFYVAGMQAATGSLNQKICRPFIGRCPSNELMTGINADGTPICSAGICSLTAPSPAVITLPTAPTPVPPIFSDGGGDGGGDGCGGDGGDGGC